MEYPSWLEPLLERFARAEEEIYLVGGCVRDFLLGNTPHDFDLTTSALPQQTARICEGYRVIETGIRHGTVTVIAQGHPVEITTFRIDGTYSDARRPDSVRFTRCLADDLSRRDFTVNAMAYHPSCGVVDLFGGREDLQNRCIRTVGDPCLRFDEDALRILRAFRFAARLGFTIHPKTLEGAAVKGDKLALIAKERIASEFFGLLLAPDPAPSLRLMAEHGILSRITDGILPSEQGLTLLSQAPANTDARLGLLFADEEEDTLRTLLRRLKCSNRCISGALAVRRGASLSVHSPKDIGRFRAATGEYAADGLAVSILRGRSPQQAERWLRESRAPHCIADLAVTGKDLMALGCSGKEIGQILTELLDTVLEHPEQNQKEVLLALARAARNK